MTLRVDLPGPVILSLCLGLTLGGCERGERPREAPGVSVAAASDGGPAWELVYDLEVDGNADLWAVSASGAEPRRLTRSPGYDGMARFTPESRQAEFFGFYAFSGKVTTFAGPLLVGIVGTLFQSVRAGMSVVAIFFVAGGVMLSFVDEAKGIQAGL